MRIFLICCFGFDFFLEMTGTASARCSVESFRFYLANETVNTSAVTDGKCYIGFGGGTLYSFNSSQSQKNPAHGLLQKRERLNFSYEASKGFKGKDAISIKICGTNKTGTPGCSVINYDITVD